MADWPAQIDGGRYETIGENLGPEGVGPTQGKGVTAGTANNEGNWVELEASTAFDGEMLFVTAHSNQANTVSDYHLSIGIGASGAEKKIIDSIQMSRSGDTDGGFNNLFAWFPIAIPAGTRISARVRCSTASAILNVQCFVFAQGFMGPPVTGRFISYGPVGDGSDTGSVGINPGTTANTLSGWVEVAASTTAPARYLYLAIGAQQNGTRTAGTWLISIALGASGAEPNNIIIGPLLAGLRAGNDLICPSFFGPFTVDIPAGSRIAVAAQTTITDDTDNNIDVAVYLGG